MKNPRWFQYADIVGPTAPCTQSSTQISDPYLQFAFSIVKSSSQAWAASESLEELIQIQISGPYLRVSDSKSLGWSPGIYISNNFPGDAEAASLQTTSWEPLWYSIHCVCIVAERKKSVWNLAVAWILSNSCHDWKNHTEYMFQDHINLHFINLLCSHLTSTL